MKAKDSQGNFQEIHIRASDELPVGSEIEFSGTSADIPAGWQIIPDTSGTDANGGYIKFSDGTMICYGKTGSIAINSTEVSTTLNFSQEFINAPIITGSINDAGPLQTSFSSALGISATTTTVTFNVKSLSGYNPNARFTGNYIAIGRWK